MSEFGPPYQAGDYERALAVLNDVLADYPGNPGITFNLGCMEARLGRTDDALEHVRFAIENWERAKELAAHDDDLESLRDHPEFQQLIA